MKDRSALRAAAIAVIALAALPGIYFGSYWLLLDDSGLSNRAAAHS